MVEKQEGPHVEGAKYVGELYSPLQGELSNSTRPRVEPHDLIACHLAPPLKGSTSTLLPWGQASHM
jgi:hypothetical protein